MKRSHLIFTIIVLAAIPTIAQEQRQRFFDNFDTARGVQVNRPVFIPVGAKGKTTLTKNKGRNAAKNTAMYSPAAGPLLKKTVQTRMNVSEGLADRELGRTASTRQLIGSSAGLKGFTTGDPIVDSYIVDSSRRYSIDPLLIYSQMHQESSFKLKATSNKGASGLMQLMPGTARRMGVTNIYDPKQNIEGGVKYMRLLLDMFGGDVNLALAGYNAGEGAVMKYGNQIPPYNETQEYVRRISARYTSISDGSMARNMAHKVTNSQAAKLEQKPTRPLSMYEPNAVAIRLADGRMRLVNQ